MLSLSSTTLVLAAAHRRSRLGPAADTELGDEVGATVQELVRRYYERWSD